MRIVIAAYAACVLMCGTASAQGWAAAVIPDVIGQTIGQQVAAQREAQCMAGALVTSDDKLMTIRSSAQNTMADYITLASASPSADVRRAFSRRRDHRDWSLDGAAGEVTAVDDPAARALATSAGALPEPDAFLVAGDEQTAIGQWSIPAAEEAPGAQYHATFRRERRKWVLERLELAINSARFAPLAPFCHHLGDVKPATPAEAPAASESAEAVTSDEDVAQQTETAPQAVPGEP